MYRPSDITLRGRTLITLDGKYHTGLPDPQGYSYWRDQDGDRIGSFATDYVFACGTRHDRACEKLNKLIIKEDKK